MSSRKHRKKSKKAALTKMPLMELEKNAALYLENGRYKKAIESYKAILSMKQDDNEATLCRLMQSYNGRVKELEQKGMHHESIELYEHVKRMYGKELDIPFYIRQLFLIASYPKAIRELYTHQDTFSDPKQFHTLESIVALLFLADSHGIRDLVPPESLIATHKHYIEEALHALFLKKEEKIGEILRPIGLRSPYRDWKSLIKGLVAFYHHNDKEAAEIFRRIPDEAPIACITSFFHSLISSALESRSLSPLPEQTDLLNTIMGDQAPLIALCKAFKEAYQVKYSREMLKIIKKIADHLPQDADKDLELLRQCSIHVLLNASYTKGTPVGSLMKIYKSLWGDTLPSYEENRISALFYEKQSAWEMAIDSWEACLDDIKHNRADRYFRTGEEKNLAIAQILRRIADHCPKENALTTIFHAMVFGKKSTPQYDYISYLMESVKFDPTEEEVYKNIINFYTKYNNRKEAQKWTEKLLTVFPDNSDALLSAATMAFQRNAFQKALRYLEKLLHYDPLNEKAQYQKISIHIYSARKRIAKKQFSQARKDFQTASAVSNYSKGQVTLHIVWGIAEIVMGNEEEGHTLIRKGIQLSHKDTHVYFFTLLEGINWHVSKKVLSAYYEILTERLQERPSIRDISHLVQIPFHVVQDNESLSPLLRKEMQIIGPCLKKALHSLTFSEKVLLAICHYLATARLYPLLVQYAHKGIEECRENPRFLFFEIIGESKGVYDEYDIVLEDDLLDIQDLCAEVNDHNTALEIENFIEHKHPLYTRNPSEKDQESIFKPVVRRVIKKPNKTQPKPPKSKPTPRGRQLPLFGPGAEGVS
ncbi:MAG: tetratricopeptide repeat protein [bacterium]